MDLYFNTGITVLVLLFLLTLYLLCLHNTNCGSTSIAKKRVSISACGRDQRMGMVLFFGVLSCCFSFRVSVVSAATTSTNTSSSDLFFVSCGVSGSSSDDGGRTWVGDVGSNFTLSSLQTTSADTPKRMEPSVPSIPYSIARFFTSNFTYSFPVSPGRYFIRFHFYPTNYTNHTDYLARFSVTSGQFTLLSNFSSSQTAQALNTEYLVREFSIVVSNSSKVLGLTFAPSSNLSNSYAFVNGIEIVSMPDIFDSAKPRVVASSTIYPVGSDVAFETAYRLNVGGNYISPGYDSRLFREWYDDRPYIYGAALGVTYSKDANVTINMDKVPSFIAPIDVYSTARSMGSSAQVNFKYNLTWILNVDSGFNYLVRLHFCEIQFEITKPNQRVFDIVIHNQTAEGGFDVIDRSGGIGNPYLKDFVVILQQGTDRQDLWVSLRPNDLQNPDYDDGILNGMEIFKLSLTDNLAGANPIPSNRPTNREPNPSNDLPPGKKSHVRAIAGVVVVVGFLVLLFLLTYYLLRRRNRFTSITNNQNKQIVVPSDICRRFTFAEMNAATHCFNENRILGIGGFGTVYRGMITLGSNGYYNVAIKRSNPKSVQGIVEFQTELDMLSKLRHRHLVSLIGYCHEKGEMILVYDYMANGTFREHLYKTKNPPLPWKKRLEICIGAARGLHYLHTGGKHTIIHRDVKTTNILLDENWVAKVSDFGLSKTDPKLDQNQTISTAIKGSFGYMDPEYIRRWQLSEKSDVYSFGVVLFEVLCGRPPVDSSLPEEQVNLADWVLECRERGVLDQIVDPILKGEIETLCLEKFVEIAMKCLGEKWIDRPNMADVLWGLELALELQESTGGQNCNTLDREDNDHIALVSVTSETDGMTTSGIISVFSETRNKEGR